MFTDVFANGGPYDYSHFRKTGNIRLMRNAEVELIKEVLSLKIVDDFTVIDVEYHLRNVGKAQDIQYGFPVDAYGEGFGFGDVWPAFQSDGDFVEYFRMNSDGGNLKVAQWIVDSVYTAKAVALYDEPEYYEIDSLIILRKWYTCTLHFSESETKVLHVSYKVKNNLSDKWPGFEGQPRFSRRHFTYDLKPSGNWGNGIVGNFSLLVDASDLIKMGCVPRTYGLSHSLVLNDSGVGSFTSTDYDLNQAGRIEIEYDNSFLKYAKFISEEEIPRSKVKRIRTSSDGQNAPFLCDGNPLTTWKGSEGDWIEIEFDVIPSEPRFLFGVYALNGNYSSPNAFMKSGKLVEVEILVNDSAFYVPDPWMGQHKSYKVHLSEPKYIATGREYLKGCANLLAEGYGLYLHGMRVIRKIRIQILRIDPDQNDKCEIAELYLTGT